MKHVVDGTPRGRADHSGWSIAAALGLLAAAFLVERFAPLEDEIHPPQAEAKRDTSAAVLAAECDGRGRHATSPSEIPAKGWKDILWRVYGNIGEHRILALAAGMTYYSILAIFPAIAALAAIYGFFRIQAASPGTSTTSPASSRAVPSTWRTNNTRALPPRATGPSALHVRDRAGDFALERERRHEVAV